MTIEWETDRIHGSERRRDGATDTRHGVVQGQRRFRLDHVEGTDPDAGWEARDLGAGDGSGASARGTYAQCVEWCWQRLSA